LTGKTASTESCQVDFYLLGESSSGADKIACRLALMAWERKQKIFIITLSEKKGSQLGKLMWQYPEGRFLPHSSVNEVESTMAPVMIGTLFDLKPTDVVINLCPAAVPQPERFSRILEIVPFADDERQASRLKYKIYRNLGLNPRTHEIDK